MLRCSLTFSIAICFVCTPTLFGQGFPSQLNDALQANGVQSTTSAPGTSTVKKQIRQRHWLGDTAPIAKTPFGPKKQDGARQPQAQKKPSFDTESVKGTPFKPTPNYMKYRPTQASQEMPKPYSPTDIPEFNIAPKQSYLPKPSVPQSSFVPRPKFVPKPSLTPQPKSISAAPVSKKKASTNPPSQEPSLNRQSKLSEIDPAIRQEIEEQVRRDLEEKFDSKIESLVKKQVREQVREARYKMERTSRNSRVASRPTSSSTYRAPGTRREAPTVTGEVLPLIVTGDSKPKPPANPARYLLTDTVPGPDFDPSVYKPPRKLAPRTTNRREPQSAQERLRDGAQSKPKSDTKSDTQSILIARETESESESPIEAPADSAQAENALAENPAAQNAEQIQNFNLRTSVIGPETLLKDVSDSYEITISNITNHPATNVIVQLTVPDEITISKLDRDAYLDQKQRTVSWKVASIGPGQQEVIRYRAVSSSTGKHDQEVTLGMENTFQGKTPFTTVVQAGAPKLPVAAETNEDYIEVAERLDFEQ